MAKIRGSESPGSREAAPRGTASFDADFRAVFNAMFDAVLVVRADPPHFTVIAASDAYVRVSGRSRDQLLGQSLFELFPDNPLDPKASGVHNLTQSFERVIHTQAHDSMALQKYDVSGPNGQFEERWWTASNGPVFDESGAVAWILHRVEEVTNLVRLREHGREQSELLKALQTRTGEMELEVIRRAEEVEEANRQLRDTNEQLRRLDAVNAAARARAEAAEERVSRILENLTDGFLSFDRDWCFTYVNARAEELLGRPRSALLGQRLWEAYPQAWDSPFGVAYRRAMKQQEKVELEARSGASERWIQVHAHPSPDGLSVYVHDITERHRTEESLRESEGRFRTIFNESMDAAMITRPDGTIALANAASTKLFGYSEEEFRHLRREDVVDSRDPVLVEALARRHRTGRFRGEVPALRKDGQRFLAEVSSAVFHDAHGAAWTSTLFRDISRRKAQEEEREQLLARLHEEQSWLRAVLHNSPMGIILFEPGRSPYVNERAEKLLGLALSSEEGIAHYENKILYPDGRPVPRDQLISSRVLRNGETFIATELLVQQTDGTRVPILGSAAPIQDEQGHVVGAIALFQDVSDRMRAEEAIRASERLLRGMFELLPVGVWIADSTGKIVRHNPAAERIWAGALHVDASEYSQYKGWWADTGEPVALDDWGLARALKKGETSLGQHIRIQCFDGTFKTILNSAMPLRDEKGAFVGVIVVNEDVTHLRDVEEELRRAIRARDEVLSIVAHDLRNPVSGILVQVESLARHTNDERTKRAIDAIRRQSSRMRRLIQDLLDLTRLDSGTFSLQRCRVPAGELLADTMESQHAIVSAASIELELDARGDLPDLWADHDRILQVLENLVGNAVKFTHPEGRITIGAEPLQSEVVFWVADTGAGISSEDIPHLFDRFWQAVRTDRRGAGLGLAIVKGIVEASGGRLWIESRVGEGSTFFFTVPTFSGAERERGVAPTLH